MSSSLDGTTWNYCYGRCCRCPWDLSSRLATLGREGSLHILVSAIIRGPKSSFNRPQHNTGHGADSVRVTGRKLWQCPLCPLLSTCRALSQRAPVMLSSQAMGAGSSRVLGAQPSPTNQQGQDQLDPRWQTAAPVGLEDRASSQRGLFSGPKGLPW